MMEFSRYRGVKYCLVFMCIALLLLSVTLLAIIIASWTFFQPMYPFLRGYVLSGSASLIVGGAAGIFSIWGMWGAISLGPNSLKPFSLVMFCLCILQSVMVILLATHWRVLAATIESYITFHVLNYEDSIPTKSEMDYVQANMNCCGTYDYMDWTQYTMLRYIPKSCCPNRKSTSTSPDCKYPRDIQYIFMKGCFQVLQDSIRPIFITSLALISLISVLQITVSVLAWLYANQLQRLQPKEIHIFIKRQTY